ncbi:hypothetical protein TSMEX_009980 [Taenia solium]|eukprot:TsM_000315600 transcript=TsM_000315600 gene=TsM_000315600
MHACCLRLGKLIVPSLSRSFIRGHLCRYIDAFGVLAFRM